MHISYPQSKLSAAMAVGDMIRAVVGPREGQVGIIVAENHSPDVARYWYATCDILWADGTTETYVGKRFLEVINSAEENS